MVAASDIGICLHTSSSGLDLPMKVVDMFSTGLPCLAIKYDTIHELVKEGQNGHIFTDSSNLAELMEEVLFQFDYEEKTEVLRRYRDHLN